MIKSYFKIAFRNLWKNKVFSAVNILGLAIGISASLVIFLIVQYDFSFDKFEKDSDRIYRIVSINNFSGENFKNSGVPVPLPNGVRDEITGIEESSAFWTEYLPKVTITKMDVAKPAVYKKQQQVVYADDHYFKLFSYKWLAGSAQTSLKKANSVVLSESRAAQYFPGEKFSNIIGKEVVYNDTIHTAVTGIVKDLDKQHTTDFIFKEFISFATIEANSGLKENKGWDEWTSTNSASQFFIKLSPNTLTAQIEKQLTNLEKKHHDKNDEGKTFYKLQSLNDIHFNADYGNYDLPLANKPTLYGLLAVAAFLLLLGCINFINLATAQSSQRAKEIGIRKTMGASKRKLMFQFLSETFLLTLMATILSIALAPLILKVFSDFISPGLHFDILQQPLVLLFIFILIIVVSILSGFYPALVLSGYKPVLVLKNQAYANTSQTRRLWLRKSLTVTQFIIAQVFIMATVIVSKQIHYSLNTNMGFKQEAILNIYTPFNFFKPDGRKNVFADKLRSIPEIQMISVGGPPPASGTTMSSTLKYKDGKKEINTDVQFLYGDSNYIKLYRIKLLAGSNLLNSDTVKEFIINETYAEILGFQNPAVAIGKTIEQNNRHIPITGVVADFHQKSLHEPIKPMILTTGAMNSYTIHISLEPQGENNTWKTAINKIQSIWKEVYPDEDFNNQFFDESIAKFYESDQKISGLLTWATGLAVLISCLGLLGLVIYTSNQRTKEIGVRKVLGASVMQIVSLLSKDFLKLVLIAFAIAAPIAWWSMHEWLQNFAYRTEISWWIFAASGALMVFIALITLSGQTIKSASANPVKSLRTE